MGGSVSTPILPPFCDNELIQGLSFEASEVNAAIIQVQKSLKSNMSMTTSSNIKFKEINPDIKNSRYVRVLNGDTSSNNAVTRYNQLIRSLGNLPSNTRTAILKGTLSELRKARSKIVTGLANSCA